MQEIQCFLKEKKYKKTSFKVLKTKHLLITSKINDIKGTFILDTGASNSCVGFDEILKFNLIAESSETKAAGAGATGMKTQLSQKNKLQIGSWKLETLNVVVFDMSHVNEALMSYKTKPVNGIIGADILLTGKAIIDYANCFLYLK